MTNTQSHAERELEILTKTAKDPENRPIIEKFSEEIIALCKKFGESGQSGGSAPMTARVISRVVESLCLQMPIAPITGEDWEWGTVADKFHQNNRCSAVFKGENLPPYYLDAIVWKGEDKWDQFSGSVEGITSRQSIKSFPFKPKTFYVDVYRVPYDKENHSVSDAVSCGSGDFVYFIKDREKLKEVFEYYDLYQDNLETE